MNYTLKKNYERIYGSKELEDGRITTNGYIDRLQCGNLLVYCGSSLEFNQEMHSAIQGNILDSEIKMLSSTNKAYFYMVKKKALNYIIDRITIYDKEEAEKRKSVLINSLGSK